MYTPATHAPTRSSALTALPAGARALAALWLKLPIGCLA